MLFAALGFCKKYHVKIVFWDNFQKITPMAMVRDVFAIAGWARNRHTEQAFQASSPKTSTTRPSGRVFFCPSGAWRLASGLSHRGHGSRLAKMSGAGRGKIMEIKRNCAA